MGTLINLYASSPSIGHHLMIDLNVGNSELIIQDELDENGLCLGLCLSENISVF
jgi:hypothetical protein